MQHGGFQSEADLGLLRWIWISLTELDLRVRYTKNGSEPMKNNTKLVTMQMKMLCFLGRKTVCVIYCPVHPENHLLNSCCHSGLFRYSPSGCELHNYPRLYHLYFRWGNQGSNEEQKPGDVKLLAQTQGPERWRRQSLTGVLVHKTCSPSTCGSRFSLHTWDSSLNDAQWEERKQFVVKLVKAINKMDL